MDNLQIGYSFPLLGYDPGSIGLTNDEYLLVRICEQEFVFCIEQTRVQAFLNYLNRSCAPKKLDVSTSVAFAVPPQTAADETPQP